MPGARAGGARRRTGRSRRPSYDEQARDDRRLLRLFKLGAIAAPIRTAFTFAELAPILARLKPALYIGDMGLYENVAPVDASILARGKRFIVNGTFEEHGVQPWEMLFEGADANLSVSPAPYKPAVLINTSGTTGQPKFVVHTPTTLAESVDSGIGDCRTTTS
jgi:long-chain acyl-CoA synthetase